ncbi:60S ribosomal protein L19 [Clonorchis sinensis]|uniref:60S ribosomal protein L19 n=1 Tax=Clonorchis sinensis TaxID=79923 RepID=H2KQY5_CLOSI|nr:60S ribosomal protein L19 [Clonorchis sinensis]
MNRQKQKDVCCLTRLSISLLVCLAGAVEVNVSPEVQVVRTGNKVKLAINCIPNQREYCKDKPVGFEFNDGCRACQCKSDDSYCSTPECVQLAEENTEPEKYCKDIMENNIKSVTERTSAGEVGPDRVTHSTSFPEHTEDDLEREKVREVQPGDKVVGVNGIAPVFPEFSFIRGGEQGPSMQEPVFHPMVNERNGLPHMMGPPSPMSFPNNMDRIHGFHDVPLNMKVPSLNGPEAVEKVPDRNFYGPVIGSDGVEPKNATAEALTDTFRRLLVPAFVRENDKKKVLGGSQKLVEKASLEKVDGDIQRDSSDKPSDESNDNKMSTINRVLGLFSQLLTDDTGTKSTQHGKSSRRKAKKKRKSKKNRMSENNKDFPREVMHGGPMSNDISHGGPNFPHHVPMFAPPNRFEFPPNGAERPDQPEYPARIGSPNFGGMAFSDKFWAMEHPGRPHGPSFLQHEPPMQEPMYETLHGPNNGPGMFFDGPYPDAYGPIPEYDYEMESNNMLFGPPGSYETGDWNNVMGVKSDAASKSAESTASNKSEADGNKTKTPTSQRSAVPARASVSLSPRRTFFLAVQVLRRPSSRTSSVKPTSTNHRSARQISKIKGLVRKVRRLKSEVKRIRYKLYQCNSYRRRIRYALQAQLTVPHNSATPSKMLLRSTSVLVGGYLWNLVY